MEAAAAAKPTPKQAKVLGYLSQGKSVAEIAKRMKISNNAVYGHMRALKDRGLLDEEGAVGASREEVPATSNGHGPNEFVEALQAARSQAEKRVAVLNEEIKEREVEKNTILESLKS